MEAKATKTIEEHPEFGKILKVEYADGVCVYLATKKGLTIKIPNSHEAVKKKDEKGEVSIIFNKDDLDVLNQSIDWFDKETGGD